MLAEEVPSPIPTGSGQMHTLNLKKSLPLHLFGIDRPKRTLFLEKFEKIFERIICIKNFPSLVPTGRGLLETVFLKKSKKIARNYQQSR